MARLTRRANQVQIGIIAEIIEPAPLTRRRAFPLSDARVCDAGFSAPNAVRGIFVKFDMSGKSPA
jgi:hypothetical protein